MRERVAGEHDLIGVLVSDLHWSHTAPLARQAEEDWYAAMERYLEQLFQIANGLPIFVAGDLTHSWRSPAELVNWLLKKLRGPIYAVAGNHDLPFHNYRDIHKSAYWTLVEAGKIINLEPGVPLELDNLVVYGFPCGYQVSPCPRGAPLVGVNLAVVHSYVWMKGHDYQGASSSKRLRSYRKLLRGYHAAVFGDNHSGFLARCGKCWLYNSGTFMRRRRDEIPLKPSVGLLYASGKIKRRFLDTTEDKFTDVATRVGSAGEPIDLEALVEELNDLGDGVMDFIACLLQFLETHHVSPRTKGLLLQAAEERHGKA